MIAEWRVADSRNAYAELLLASGFKDRGPLIPAKTLTTDPTQIDRLFGAAEAPEALAMLSEYGTGVGLHHGDPNWSVSCLPNYSSHSGYRRAATITIGSEEVFYVWMELATGQVSGWGMLIDNSAEHEIASEVLTSSDVSQTQHGLFLTGHGFEQFLELTRAEGIRAAALQAARGRRVPELNRRAAWHNSFLSQALNLEEPRASVDADDVARVDADSWNVKMAYYSYSARLRKHQSRFRRLLLENTHPPVCAVCDLDVVEVLEAAHIIPDAAGGAASSDNALLLCANHHRAMDSGLLTWVDERAHWGAGAKKF